jgi:hypothetical protein
MTTVFKNYLAASVGTQLTVTAVAASTPSSGSVRLTFADQGTAPFVVGQKITVSGISVTGYNGTFTVTGCTSTTVTYTNSTTGAATGGIISPCMVTSNASATTTIIGLSLTNVTPSIVQASVQLQDTVAGTAAYFVQNITMPPNTSVRLVNGGERLVVGPSTNILLWANLPSSVDVVLSWVEIS